MSCQETAGAAPSSFLPSRGETRCMRSDLLQLLGNCRSSNPSHLVSCRLVYAGLLKPPACAAPEQRLGACNLSHARSRPPPMKIPPNW